MDQCCRDYDPSAELFYHRKDYTFDVHIEKPGQEYRSKNSNTTRDKHDEEGSYS